MVKFDDFTVKYLKKFYYNRKDFILPGLKELKNKIMQSFNNKINYNIENYEIPINKIKKLVDTDWVDKDVINSLDLLNSNYKISWKYNNIEHQIFIKTTKEKFTEFIKRLPVMINLLNYIYSIKKTNEKRPLQMYLILTLLKKKIFDSNKIIGVKNVNSGYTDFMSNEILVWREEEFEKVMFHEMVHYMDLDVRNMSFNDKQLPHEIDGPKSYYEAFTDVWANIFHIIYLSIITKKSASSLFQIEFEFMRNQANLFNSHFKLENWNKKKIVKQSTPAFTYYIIKYLLFKKIIDSKNLDIMNDPKKILEEILSENFVEDNYINCDSTRMTLLQLK